MFQKHSPLGKLSNNLHQAVINMNNSLDMMTKLPSRLEDLITAKFNEMTLKIESQKDAEHDGEEIETEEEQNDEETDEFEALSEKIEHLIDNKFQELQATLEKKIDENFNQILAKIDQRDAKIEKYELDKKFSTTSANIVSLSNRIEKMEKNLTRNVNGLGDSIDKVKKLCEGYSNWTHKHENILDHSYVARSDVITPLKRFLTNQDDADCITELQNKLKSFYVVKIDRSTRFPITGVYVNIKNDLIERYYIQELNDSIKKGDKFRIRHNINAFVAILSKLETFKNYDIHNLVSFENAHALRWTV